MGKVVIWGLKTDLHSHKFIQGAYYRNFREMGFETCWVDDRESNIKIVTKDDIVFAVDVAAEHLPLLNGVKYVLHNMPSEKIKLEKGFINLQVYTSSATGVNCGLPYVQWDSKLKTLFQPWGVPTNPKTWGKPQKAQSKKEYWVGSIWNNDLGQGNSEFMKRYVTALEHHKIRFIQKGTSTRLRPNGISESLSMKLVYKSAIGAAVVGNWQKENSYIPCRLFKNIASGVIPSSNADFSALFGTDGGIFNSNPDLLISGVLELSESKKLELLKHAQQTILPYTYTAGINRILTYLDAS
jgi:hypothetical protein